MKKELPASAHELSGLRDGHARSISYLRLSLTDRCNLRCLYCMTEGQRHDSFKRLEHEDLLTYEELVRIVCIAVDMGITKLRLTGGEPLVRRNVMHLVRQLSLIEKLKDIRITTNGVLLGKYAHDLFETGVRTVNISLDTLRRDRFRIINGRDFFAQVWHSIERVLELGFSPVKLNMVVMRGINDDEVIDFARLTEKQKIQVRFIEYMPMGSTTQWSRDTYVSSEEIFERFGFFGTVAPMPQAGHDGPARMFRINDWPGCVGFISPLSHHFCGTCNRLRLTSEGKLRPCLLGDEEHDLKTVLRNGGTDQEISEVIVSAVKSKPAGHRLDAYKEKDTRKCRGQMSRIGG